MKFLLKIDNHNNNIQHGGKPVICINKCCRTKNGEQATCCEKCNGTEGPHTDDCTIRNKCNNGCGRIKNGLLSKCCKKCSSSNGPHTVNCYIRAQEFIIMLSTNDMSKALLYDLKTGSYVINSGCIVYIILQSIYDAILSKCGYIIKDTDLFDRYNKNIIPFHIYLNSDNNATSFVKYFEIFKRMNIYNDMINIENYKFIDNEFVLEVHAFDGDQPITRYITIFYLNLNKITENEKISLLPDLKKIVKSVMDTYTNTYNCKQ